MNKLINSPQNLGKREPLAYIEATRRADYEGIGIRTYRSPGPELHLQPDCWQARPRACCPVRVECLYDYVDALPEDIDISVEAQIRPNNVYTGMEWAKINVERIRKYLARYATGRAELQPVQERRKPTDMVLNRLTRSYAQSVTRRLADKPVCATSRSRPNF